MNTSSQMPDTIMVEEASDFRLVPPADRFFS